MKDFESLDFLHLDEWLSTEELQIRASIRRFVSERYLPKVASYYQKGEFDRSLVPELAALGVLGCNLQGYECAGLSDLEYGLIMMELERGDSGLRSFASVQTSLCMFPIHTFGSEGQKQKFLPKMARGELIGCFGLSEPDFGSNPGGMLSTAEETSIGFKLNGTKRWITNGGIADLAIVWAKLNGHVQGFVVPTKSKGFLVKEIPGKLSLRASVTSELVMEDCEVSKDALLPGARGLRAALECLSSARYGIAWGVIGAAMACYQEALEYSKTRDAFGVPLAQKQLVQAKLVWMLNEITKAQLLAFRLSQLKASKKLQPHQISLAKMNNVRMALECARLARDILGANGVCDEYQCMRHMCNLESVNTYEGTHDIHMLILGKEITGLAGF